MTPARLESADTSVRIDPLGPDGMALVLYDAGGQHSVVISGTVSSVLMLADRINDRLHPYRQ